MKIAIIGAGRAGRALGSALKNRHIEIVAVAGGHSSQARDFAESIGAKFCSQAVDAVQLAQIVLLAVPDREIAIISESLAREHLPEGVVVLHICGSKDAFVLKALQDKGVAVGSMHPLQSFTENTKISAAKVADSYFAIDGDEAAMTAAKALIEAVGGHALMISPQQRALYHASACMASNYMVALLRGATQVLGKCGIEEKDALAALRPILEGTLQNILEQGTKKALTGPISRGDLETVQVHVDNLDAFLPKEGKLYKVLGAYTADFCAVEHLLPEAKSRAIQQVLDFEL